MAPVESVRMTEMDCEPMGVPGSLGGEGGEGGDDELQPERLMKMAARMRVRRLERSRRWRVRRVPMAKQSRAMEAKIGRVARRSCAVEMAGAVVTMVSVAVVGGPLAGAIAVLEKLQTISLGSGPQESFTNPAKPPDGVAVMVKVAVCPALMVAEEGEAEGAKSGGMMVTATELELLPALLVSPE
jgi:hypothetical protein